MIGKKLKGRLEALEERARSSSPPSQDDESAPTFAGLDLLPSATQIINHDCSHWDSDDLISLHERRDVSLTKDPPASYLFHLPSQSRAYDEPTIGDVRGQAAIALNTDTRNTKLVYKGRAMADDSSSCRAEGLTEGAEIICTVEKADQEVRQSTAALKGGLDPFEIQCEILLLKQNLLKVFEDRKKYTRSVYLDGLPMLIILLDDIHLSISASGLSVFNSLGKHVGICITRFNVLCQCLFKCRG